MQHMCEKCVVYQIKTKKHGAKKEREQKSHTAKKGSRDAFIFKACSNIEIPLFCHHFPSSVHTGND